MLASADQPMNPLSILIAHWVGEMLDVGSDAEFTVITKTIPAYTLKLKSCFPRVISDAVQKGEMVLTLYVEKIQETMF